MVAPSQLLLPLMLAAAPAAAQQRFLNDPSATKYAAINLVPAAGGLPAGLSRTIGEGDAGATPLMVQDKLWEPRCDNAYPNVVHNPGDKDGEFRLWYGCFSSGTKFSTSQGACGQKWCPLGCRRGVNDSCLTCRCAPGSDRTNAWMYANSSDGLTWTKPNLGVYNLATGVGQIPDLILRMRNGFCLIKRNPVPGLTVLRSSARGPQQGPARGDYCGTEGDRHRKQHRHGLLRWDGYPLLLASPSILGETRLTLFLMDRHHPGQPRDEPLA